MVKIQVNLLNRDAWETLYSDDIWWLVILQNRMISLGWLIVEFDFCHPRVWYDEDHPRSCHVVKFLIKLIRDQINQGMFNVGDHIALFGDSVTAFSVDRKKHQTFKNMRRMIRNATGVNVWLYSKSGTWYDSSYKWNKETRAWIIRKKGFIHVAQDLLANNRWFDHVLMVGGWNIPDQIYKQRINRLTRRFDMAANALMDP